MNEIVSAILIFWVILAIPSVAYGITLAQRSNKSVVIAVIVCLLLPWIGCLFFLSQPPGDSRMGGVAYYSTSMLGISALMAAISIFLPWVTGDPSTIGEEAYAPVDLLVFAVLIGVWVLCLIAGTVAINRSASMVGGVLLGIVVSVAGATLASLVHLWGSVGVFVPELRDTDVSQQVEVGSGGWVALVALIVAYVSVTLLPFGLRFTPRTYSEPPMMQPAPPQAPMPGGQMPQGQWPPAQQPPEPQFPSSSGAGW